MTDNKQLFMVILPILFRNTAQKLFAGNYSQMVFKIIGEIFKVLLAYFKYFDDLCIKVVHALI